VVVLHTEVLGIDRRAVAVVEVDEEEVVIGVENEEVEEEVEEDEVKVLGNRMIEKTKKVRKKKKKNRKEHYEEKYICE